MRLRLPPIVRKDHRRNRLWYLYVWPTSKMNPQIQATIDHRSQGSTLLFRQDIDDSFLSRCAVSLLHVRVVALPDLEAGCENSRAGAETLAPVALRTAKSLLEPRSARFQNGAAGEGEQVRKDALDLGGITPKNRLIQSIFEGIYVGESRNSRSMSASQITLMRRRAASAVPARSAC